MEKQSSGNNSFFLTASIILLLIAIFEGWLLYQKFTNPTRGFIMPSYFYYDEQEELKGSMDSYVSAKGSWVSDTLLANPYQTVEVTCWKQFNHCIVHTAYLSEERLLTSDSNYYEIDDWMSDKITVIPNESAAGCVSDDVEINRITKKVTQRRITLNTTGLCQGIQEAPIISQLGDGEERLKKIKIQNQID